MTPIEHPSPNHSPRKPGVRVDTVLLHHTATAATAVGNQRALGWLRDATSGVSAHYVITTVGAIYQLVPEHLKAWHAGRGRLPWETCAPYDFNHRSIGVELVNPGDGKTPFTEAQYLALGELLPDIVRRLEWSSAVFCNGWSQDNLGERIKFDPFMPRPVRSGYILGHRDVAPGRKTDPADNFDWGRMREMLGDTRHEHWPEVQSTCDAFREYARQAGVDADSVVDTVLERLNPNATRTT